MKKSLTRLESDALRAIQRFVKSKGFPPKRTELADALGLKDRNARQKAQSYVSQLVSKGYLTITGPGSRNIKLV